MVVDMMLEGETMLFIYITFNYMQIPIFYIFLLYFSIFFHFPIDFPFHSPISATYRRHVASISLACRAIYRKSDSLIHRNSYAYVLVLFLVVVY